MIYMKTGKLGILFVFYIASGMKEAEETMLIGEIT